MITKHKNRHKVFEVIPTYNEHPFCSLKNWGKKVHIVHSKIWYMLTKTKQEKPILNCRPVGLDRRYGE